MPNHSTTDRFARLLAGYEDPDIESRKAAQRAEWDAQGTSFFEGKPPKLKEGEPAQPPPIVGLNEGYWVSRFADETGVIYDPAADTFYWYSHGLWSRKTKPEIREYIARHVRDAVRQEQCDYIRERDEMRAALSTQDDEEEEEPLWMRLSVQTLAKILSKRSLDQIVDRLQGHHSAVKRDAFSNPPHGIILVRNGRLEISKIGKIKFEEEAEGRREDMQMHRLPIDYNPKAQAPDLLAWLNRIFRGREGDVQAVAKMLGVCLWGSSRWKKVIVIYGGANRGKSQIPLLAERLVGTSRVADFETRRLGERFEKRRFVGKVLLRAEDVDPDFMTRTYAGEIKSITGFGSQRTEGKHTDDELALYGDKIVSMTSNFELRVLPGADRSAWEERLVYLFADGPGFEGNEQDSYFLDRLFESKESASGVLNFALQGIQGILQAGAWERSEEQMARVMQIMENADSVRKWVEARIVVTPASDGVTSSEAWADYRRWCEAQGLDGWTQHQFERLVYDAVESVYRKTRSGSVRRGETDQRGWLGVRLADGKRHES